MIPTEKPSVEKSDKITADTLAPEIKEIVETIKTLNENSNVQSQIVVNTDIVKIDESITLKAEEKIKIIEEKERSMDLQKNDNLINLDAIKKEESELAADGDVANARAAERHEQLRKTLEKHKLEQRQMMQEQKKILKDIKEQKKEFEREKQRMAKDEILKKTEKQVEIKEKENVLSEIKSDLKESNKRAEENEVNIEKSNKEDPLEDKEQNIADKVKPNEKQQSPQIENNDVNIAVKDNEQKSQLFQKVSNNKNIGESQKMSEDKADKSPADEKKTVIEKAPEQVKGQDETRTGNDSESMKSPILNVLSKGVLQRSVAEEGLVKDNQVKEEKREVLANEANNASDKLQKHDDKYYIPIALKIMNQSKLDKTITSSLNKSEPQVLAIRRDILQNNEREKRDIDAEANASDAKISSVERPIEKSKIFIKNDADNADRETCSKLQEDSKKSGGRKESEKRVTKSSTTETSLIKTNVYLSEQRITKEISIDGRVPLDVEYVSMQQRDLNPKNNIEI